MGEQTTIIQNVEQTLREVGRILFQKLDNNIRFREGLPIISLRITDNIPIQLFCFWVILQIQVDQIVKIY